MLEHPGTDHHWTICLYVFFNLRILNCQFSKQNDFTAPSSLPLPARCDTNSYLKQVKQAERTIKERSKRSEGKWCIDKFQTSSAGGCLVFVWFRGGFKQIVV